jgi:hypothetical protein
MRTSRPTTGAAFARLEVLDRPMDSAASRCFLFGRDDPTDPFVPRQRRQTSPGRLRLRFRADRHAQVCRGVVHGTGLAGVALYHFIICLMKWVENALAPYMESETNRFVLTSKSTF